jgi:hypothetical protein
MDAPAGSSNRQCQLMAGEASDPAATARAQAAGTASAGYPEHGAGMTVAKTSPGGPMTSPQPQAPGAARASTAPSDPAQASTGELIGQLTDQLSRLVRDEVRLAQAEVTQKAKRLGIGAGLFGGAGLVAVLGLGALVTAAVLGLATVLPGWLAGIVVAVVLFLIAGLLALLGKKDVQQAAPPLPTETIASVQADLETVKQGIAR